MNRGDDGEGAKRRMRMSDDDDCDEIVSPSSPSLSPSRDDGDGDDGGGDDCDCDACDCGDTNDNCSSFRAVSLRFGLDSKMASYS